MVYAEFRYNYRRAATACEAVREEREAMNGQKWRASFQQVSFSNSGAGFGAGSQFNLVDLRSSPWEKLGGSSI